MARLSNCNLYDRSHLLVRPINVMRALFFTGVLCALSLGQIHLGFLQRDLMIETRKLQGIYTEMLDRRNTLTAEVEEKRVAAFQQLHRDNPLGLAECPPERRFTGRVTATAVERWSEPAPLTVAPTGAPNRQKDRLAPARALGVLVERVLASPSFARAPDGDS